MATFARARAKSLFSKLFPQAISKTYLRTNDVNAKQEKLICVKQFKNDKPMLLTKPLISERFSQLK